MDARVKPAHDETSLDGNRKLPILAAFELRLERRKFRERRIRIRLVASILGRRPFARTLFAPIPVATVVSIAARTPVVSILPVAAILAVALVETLALAPFLLARTRLCAVSTRSIWLAMMSAATFMRRTLSVAC